MGGTKARSSGFAAAQVTVMPTGPEQVIGQVHRGHLRTPASRQQRGVAAARAQVQHPQARPDPGSLYNRGAHPGKLLRYPRVIPGGPQRAVHPPGQLIVLPELSLTHASTFHAANAGSH